MGNLMSGHEMISKACDEQVCGKILSIFMMNNILYLYSSYLVNSNKNQQTCNSMVLIDINSNQIHVFI